MEWEREETVPEHVFQTFAKANMLLPALPAPLPTMALKDLGIHDILGHPIDDWDYFHNMIYTGLAKRIRFVFEESSLTIL